MSETQQSDATITKTDAPPPSSFRATLDAAATVEAALQPLDSESRLRVLDFVISHYGIKPVVRDAKVRGASEAGRRGLPSDAGEQVQENGDAPKQQASFDHVADLYDAAGPTTDTEKALVVGYYLQFYGGQEHFFAHEVNSALKHMGYAVGNITRALDKLTSERPAHVIQLAKTGKAQQARKKFKVTREGQKRVEQMIAATKQV